MGMFRSINKRASSSAHGGHFLGTRARFECPRQLTKFAVASVILAVAMTSFAVTSNAAETNVQGDALSALRQYVQLIDTDRKSVPTPVRPQISPDKNPPTSHTRRCAHLRNELTSSGQRRSRVCRNWPKLTTC